MANERDEPDISSTPELSAVYEQMVREEWSAAPTVEAWRKWSDKFAVYSHPLTRAILDFSELEPNLEVLDLASGTGSPAIEIAERVAPDGLVTATDLSTEMLRIAERNARQAGAGNMLFRPADAHDLPFEDESFDRVTCRIGVMYFWECQRAMKEILRVLRPGGIAAFVAWGPVEQSPLTVAFLGPFMSRKELPEAPPDAPLPLRFAPPGSLSSELRRAGFQSVKEETRIDEMAWPGPPDELYQHLYDIAVPMQPYIDSLGAEDLEAAVGEVVTGFEQAWDGEYIRAESAINVAAGRR